MSVLKNSPFFWPTMYVFADNESILDADNIVILTYVAHCA